MTRILGQNLGAEIREIKRATDSFSVHPITYRGDWRRISEPLSYLSANVIVVDDAEVDLTSIFALGNKIRYKQGGDYQFAYVTAVTTNTITINTGTDYLLANATITDFYKGIVDVPSGHPVVLSFNPNFDAVGANYTPGTPAGLSYKFSMSGPEVTIYQNDGSGASVDGACVLSFELPVPAREGTISLIAMLNTTETIGLVKIADSLVGPTPPENYGFIFKDIGSGSLISGNVNHFGTTKYIAG